jgi:hypothetical protein
VKRNASPSIRDNFDPDSNVIESSDLQEEKHDSQITSTDAGRRIDARQLGLNAHRSIRCNREFGSKMMEMREMHSEKQHSQITSTESTIRNSR